MHGYKLALKGGHQFGGREAMLLQCPDDLVGIGLAFGATMQVEKAGVGTRELQPLVPKARRPFGDPGQGVEGRDIARKLRDEQRGSFDRVHGGSLLDMGSIGLGAFDAGCRKYSRTRTDEIVECIASRLSRRTAQHPLSGVPFSPCGRRWRPEGTTDEGWSRGKRDGFHLAPPFSRHGVRRRRLNPKAIALRAIPLIRRCFATTPSPARGEGSRRGESLYT